MNVIYGYVSAIVVNTFMQVLSSFVVRFGTLLVLIAALLASGVTPAFAQPAGGSGIGISPALIEERATPGQTMRYVVTISNLSDSEQKYYTYVRDIVGVKGDNSPVYADDGAEKTGFELSGWIALDAAEVIVPAGGEVPLPFTMKVPDNATLGSPFCALFVSM